MGKITKNKSFKLLIAAGVVLFAVIAFVIVKSTATTTAIVAVGELSSGTKLDEKMLKSIKIPVKTPKGFITDKKILIGRRLKTNITEGQLIYLNNTATSGINLENGDIPEDYVITSIEIPSSRAVGGNIVAGNVVDILGVPTNKSPLTSGVTDDLSLNLGEIAKNSYGANGTKLYWVLSNVKIISSNSEENSKIKQESSGETSNGVYTIALSYADYKKVILSKQYLDLWMNIAPVQNIENGPLFEEMNERVIQELKDSQTQSKIDITKKDKNTKEDKDKEIKK